MYLMYGTTTLPSYELLTSAGKQSAPVNRFGIYIITCTCNNMAIYKTKNIKKEVQINFIKK